MEISKINNKKIAKQINETIEGIWILIEKEGEDIGGFRLNERQHVLLTLIIRNPLPSPSQLAEMMGVTKSAVSQQLLKLEKGGFVTRVRDEHDKRAYYVELGTNGLIYEKELNRYYINLFDKYYSKLSSEELLKMLQAFQRLKTLLCE